MCVCVNMTHKRNADIRNGVLFLFAIIIIVVYVPGTNHNTAFIAAEAQKPPSSGNNNTISKNRYNNTTLAPTKSPELFKHLTDSLVRVKKIYIFWAFSQIKVCTIYVKVNSK